MACGEGGQAGVSDGGDCTNFSGSWFSCLPSIPRDNDVGRTDLKGELSADGSIS
jgi:hypothetical protein